MSEEERSRELQDYHNKGETDGAKGKCEQPHSAGSVVSSDIPFFGHIATALGEKTSEEKNEDNAAYFKGNENAKKNR